MTGWESAARTWGKRCDDEWESLNDLFLRPLKLPEASAKNCDRNYEYTEGLSSGCRLKRRWIHRYCEGACRTICSIAALTRALSATASSVGKSASGSPT